MEKTREYTVGWLMGAGTHRESVLVGLWQLADVHVHLVLVTFSEDKVAHIHAAREKGAELDRVVELHRFGMKLSEDAGGILLLC